MAKDHYVPRFYLRHFEANSKFWVIDKSQKKTWKSSADNTAKKDNFYSFIEEESGKLNQAAERSLADLEGKWSEMFRRVLADKQLPDNCTGLLEFVAFQILRTPHCAERVLAVIQATQWAHLENELSKPGLVEKYLAENPGETAESFISSVREGSFEKSPGSDVITALAQVQRVYSLLREKESLELVHAPEGLNFVTSDNPVNACIPTGAGRGKFGAFLALESQIWCPFSATIGLYIGPVSGLTAYSPEEFCNEMNQRIVVDAMRFVITTRQDSELEEFAYQVPSRPRLDKDALFQWALQIIREADSRDP